jgi:DNA-binding response OmpR family regulator
MILGDSMLNIILASARPEAVPAFVEALSSDARVHLKQVYSGAEALAAVRAAAPHLVIIDSELPDSAPRDLVQKLLLLNAMVNTAVISPLSEAEFHEQSEGLGIMTSLPPAPNADHAVALVNQLRQIFGL